MQRQRMKRAALMMTAAAAVVGRAPHAQAESIFLSSMELASEIDPTHQGTGGSPSFTWGDSFDANVVEHAQSSLHATDGAFSLHVHDPDGGFSWGTEYFINGHPMANPEWVAKWNTVQTTTKVLLDVTTVPGPGGYAAGFGAINYNGGFLDSYNPGGLGKNYGVVGSPVNQTTPITQTYTWDFGPQMVLGVGTIWGNATHFAKFHFSNNAPAGAPTDFYYDNFRFVDENTAIHPTWQASGAGDWLTPANWANGVPNAVGARAILYGAGDGNVTLDASATLGALIFDAQVTSYEHIADAAPPPIVNYTIADSGGPGHLIFDVASGVGEIFVIAGNHNVFVPVTFNDDLRIDTSAGFGPDSGAPINPNPNPPPQNLGRTSTVPVTSLVFGGPVTLAAGVTLSTGGAGSVGFNGVVNGGAGSAIHVRGGSASFGGNIDIAALNISPNARATVKPGGDKTLKVAALGMPAGAELDMTDNDLIVDHDGAITEDSIRQLVRDGRAAGSTSGIFVTPGATADDVVLAVVDNGEWNKTSFNGINIDPTTIVGKYTYFGDSNLDGQVTGDDYLAVDSNLGTGNSWIEGDFNLDNTVTGDDYLAIDTNLGKGTTNPLAYAELKAKMVARHVAMFGEEYLVKLAEVEANGFTTVPEPAAMSIIALGAAAALRRRRRI